MIQSADFDINAWTHLVDLVVEPPQPKDPIEALKAAQSGKTPVPADADLLKHEVGNTESDVCKALLRSRVKHPKFTNIAPECKAAI